MKYVVLGGAGFIGSSVVELLLERGDEVTVVDSLVSGRTENLNKCSQHKHFHFVKLSLQDTEVSQLAEIFAGNQVCIHLAAIADIVRSIDSPLDYFDHNVASTVKVLEAAREARVLRIVYSASSSCYGSSPITPTNEGAPIECRYPYALSKFLGEQLVQHWAEVYSLEYCSLRLFNVYGPRARTNGSYGAVIGVFLAQMLNGFPLTVVGDGLQKRDFTYIDDVAEAIVLASGLGKNQGVYNVSLGEPRSVLDLARMMSDKICHIPHRPGEPPVTWGDCSKFRADYDWKPRITLEVGLAECLRFSDNFRDAPLWTEGTISEATALWFRCLGNNLN